ncbi:MAG: hypothetical protein HYV09_38405 [Deltaproteobacteria bacterium]|nr:hypothetical protein [Deltaproteobacteria bacterium]
MVVETDPSCYGPRPDADVGGDGSPSDADVSDGADVADDSDVAEAGAELDAADTPDAFGDVVLPDAADTGADAT